MSARDFCSPLPQFAEWSHPQASTREQKRAQWDTDKAREKLLDLMQSVVAEMRDDHFLAAETVSVRFHRLANEWSANTMHISSASDLINDKRYQEIIDLGWDVVPYLLTDLQQNKRFWFPALAAITGVRPFDPSDTNSPRRMTEAWVRWGKRKGLTADQPSPSRDTLR